MTSFAWTATRADGGYKHYPPYVNLTGNRLTVRGPEGKGPDGNPQPGPYVAVELPDEALAGLAIAWNTRVTKQQHGDDVERVARAIMDADDNAPYYSWDSAPRSYRQVTIAQARAALDALRPKGE